MATESHGTQDHHAAEGGGRAAAHIVTLEQLHAGAWRWGTVAAGVGPRGRWQPDRAPVHDHGLAVDGELYDRGLVALAVGRAMPRVVAHWPSPRVPPPLPGAAAQPITTASAWGGRKGGGGRVGGEEGACGCAKPSSSCASLYQRRGSGGAPRGPSRPLPATTAMRLGMIGPRFGSLNGKRRSFLGGRPGKPQTHRRVRPH